MFADRFSDRLTSPAHKGEIKYAAVRPKKLLFPETRPTLVFTPTLKILWTMLGPEFFGFNFHRGLVIVHHLRIIFPLK